MTKQMGYIVHNGYVLLLLLPLLLPREQYARMDSIKTFLGSLCDKLQLLVLQYGW